MRGRATGLGAVLLTLVACPAPDRGDDAIERRSRSAGASIATIAGTGVPCPPPRSGDGTPPACGEGGPASAASLAWPMAVSVLADGSFLVVERGSRRGSSHEPQVPRVRKVEPSGRITTVAGTGHACEDPTAARHTCGDRGEAARATLNIPHYAILHPSGGFVIADRGDNRVRFVDPAGTIMTLAGNGDPCDRAVNEDGCGDGGPAVEARLSAPQSVSFADDGSLLVAGHENLVRRVGSDGTIETVAGTGRACTDNDAPAHPCGDGGPATRAALSDPHGVLALPGGDFLVADKGNNRVRKVARDTGGDYSIETVAGTGKPCPRGEAQRKKSACGDGGRALEAMLHSPVQLAAVPSDPGGYLVVDSGTNRIRYVDSSGRIRTVAGDGHACQERVPERGEDPCDGDGTPTDARLNAPHGAFVSGEDLYVADRDSNRIRVVRRWRLAPR